jgi:hypothetical protein
MTQRKVETARKITVKGVMGEKVDIEELLKTADKRQDLCTVYGIARKFKPDQSDMGSFIRFYGRFRAVNLKTGETTEAGQAILPGIVQDGLYGAMGGGEADVTEVQFAVRIGVKYNKEAVTKYVYTVESLQAPAENDPLALLESTLTDRKSLPAPKK